MTRRIAVWLLLVASIASVVVAVGLRVRAARMQDAGQALRAYVRDVPPETHLLCRIVGRGVNHLQIEMPADAVWVRRFAERNGFARSLSSIQGMSAESWSLPATIRKGAVAHILLPRGEPALLTITWE